MPSKKKRAFTLTELLIVVMVIGILSVVVLPKFNKVLETRKTTEAEEMMSAVRMEQERRCALNKRYTEEFEKLQDVIPTSQTKNYTFKLTNQGMTASSRGSYQYTLSMPSYADGRICCDDSIAGSDCGKLNKNYPRCSALIARVDYMPGESACTGEEAKSIECSGISTRVCGCNGTQERTCDTTTGQWSDWGECSSLSCSCAPDEDGSAEERTCPNNPSAKQTRSCNTSTGTWSSWSECDCAAESDGTTTSRSCSCTGTQTRSCDKSTGQWSGWGSCQGGSSAPTYTCDCATGYSGTSTATGQKTCSNGSWVVPTPKCTSTAGCTKNSTSSCSWQLQNACKCPCEDLSELHCENPCTGEVVSAQCNKCTGGWECPNYMFCDNPTPAVAPAM